MVRSVDWPVIAGASFGLAALLATSGCNDAASAPNEDLTASISDADDMDVLAVCGQSEGQAFFVDSETGDGEWTSDPTTGGSLVFARDVVGKLHVIYRTASQGRVDEAVDGAQVMELPSGPERVQAVVTYPSDGVMVTYSVSNSPKGDRKLLWTLNRDAPGIPTKAGAYVSRCT